MELNEVQEAVTSLSIGSHLILVRHARSQANQNNINIVEQGGTKDDFIKVATDPKLRDCSICEYGVKEWENAKQIASELNITTVFLSPQRRAFETAYHIFGDGGDIKFIIVPKMKEGLKAVSDILSNIDNLIDEYKLLFNNLDTSLLDSYSNRLNCFYEDLQPELRAKLDPKICEKEDDPINNNIFDLLTEEISQSYPMRTESLHNIYQRARDVEKYIASFKTNEIDEKFVLVGHYTFFMFLTGKWDNFPEDGIVTTEPNEFFEFNNWQMVNYELK